MTSTHPFGNLETAEIMIIGHDPRLQNSRSEAEYAFFFDYLLRPKPTSPSEARKYSLAQALQDYISDLAGKEIPLDQLFVTNLCNQFLPPTHGGGTVLIPDKLADNGVEEIRNIINQGHFHLILPLSAQVGYHLARKGFFDEEEEPLQTFLRKARPNANKAKQGIYSPVGTTPFLDICGRRFHHRGIPLVPVLHVKQWPLKENTRRYTAPMEKAKDEIMAVLSM